jgi:hypothetical protein
LEEVEEVMQGEGLRGEAISAVEWMAARWEVGRLAAEELAITSRVEATVAGIWVVVTGVEATGEVDTADGTGVAIIAVGEAGAMRPGGWGWVWAMV